jgi:hypothetical protein
MAWDTVPATVWELATARDGLAFGDQIPLWEVRFPGTLHKSGTDWRLLCSAWVSTQAQNCSYCLCEEFVTAPFKRVHGSCHRLKGLAIYDIPEECIELVVANSCGPRQVPGVHSDPVVEVNSSRGSSPAPPNIVIKS